MWGRLLAFLLAALLLCAAPANAQLLTTGAGSGSFNSLIAAPFVSVNGPTNVTTCAVGNGCYEGWSVQYASQPTISANVAFSVTRQGYTTTGATTSYIDTFYVTKTAFAGGAVRQPYSNQALQSALTTSINDYVYSTDTVAGGITNNSTLISPKPTCAWGMVHRSVVGNSLTVEASCFHRNARNGQQIVAFIARATDGSTTVTCTSSAAGISGATLDRHPVLTNSCTLDLTTLSTGLVTVNAKAYPWIGAAASVLDSADNSGQADFSPRYYLKNTTLAATPVDYYVSGSGSDANACTSTGAPCLTIRGAADKIQAAGVADGRRIVIIADGTYTLLGPTAGQQTQNVGVMTVTRASGTTTRAGVIVTWGNDETPRLSTGFTAPVATGALRFIDITMQRSNLFGIQGGFAGAGARLENQFVNVDVDLNSKNATLGNSVLGDYYFYGVTFTNPGTAVFNASSDAHVYMARGISLPTYASNFQTRYILGSDLVMSGGTLPVVNGTTAEGQVLAFNTFTKVNTSGFYLVNTAVTNGLAVCQNVFEWIAGASGTMLQIAADGSTTNLNGLVSCYNTSAGGFNAGRDNLLYDEGASGKLVTLQSSHGDLLASLNTKHDVYATNGQRVGAWGWMYGAGSRGLWTQYIDANSGGIGTSFAPGFAGINGSLGTSATVPQMATSRFTSYQAATVNSVLNEFCVGAIGTLCAGTGGGNYAVNASAEVKCRVPYAVLPYDLAGTARPLTNDTAGAFVSSGSC